MRSGTNTSWHAVVSWSRLSKVVHSRALLAEVIGGLEKVSDGIEKVYAGVSGKKIVIEPWA